MSAMDAMSAPIDNKYDRNRSALKNRKKLDPINSEMPSLDSMGFETKVARAFPYHPMSHLYKNHIEEDYRFYKLHNLDKRIPSFDDIERRFWRKKMIVFLQKEYS